MSRSNVCPHCNHSTLRRAPAWGVAAVAAAWLFVVGVLALAALIGPFLMFAAPVVFALGASAVRAAHDVAFAPAECGRCGKVALAEAVAEGRSVAAAPALARAA